MTTTSLVLGSSGLVGHCLCRYLEERGKRVIPYDIRRDPGEDLRSAILDMNQVDEVYLLAWDVGGSRYLYRKDTQEGQIEWNLRLLVNTLPQLKESGKRWLFTSSQMSGESNAYGLTKSIGEYWTKLAGGRTVRLWNVYGDIEEENDRSHVMSDMIRNALNSGEIHLLTDGKERRRFTFELDVCRGLEMALLYGRSAGSCGRAPAARRKIDKIYDLAGSQNISVIEVAEIIAGMTGAEVYPGTGISNWADSSVSDMLPRFASQIGIEEGLEIMIERYREGLPI